MLVERKPNTKYVCSLSYGKDSLAMLIKICELGLPLDYVIHCDIRFSDDISGEHPLMAEWIPKAEKILKDKFGIEVITLTASKNFTQQFYTKKERGNHIGDIYGFPLTLHSWCNSRLKLDPIRQFIGNLLKTNNVVEYIGIAKDEPKRLKRYADITTDRHSYITLADLDIAEQQAMDICKQNDLLSPKYSYSFRGGCWFCPKQSMGDLWDLYTNYPDYFNKLLQMEKMSPVQFRTNTTLKDIKAKFDLGIKPKPNKKHIKAKKRNLI